MTMMMTMVKRCVVTAQGAERRSSSAVTICQCLFWVFSFLFFTSCLMFAVHCCFVLSEPPALPVGDGGLLFTGLDEFSECSNARHMMEGYFT